MSCNGTASINLANYQHNALYIGVVSVELSFVAVVVCLIIFESIRRHLQFSVRRMSSQSCRIRVDCCGRRITTTASHAYTINKLIGDLACLITFAVMTFLIKFRNFPDPEPDAYDLLDDSSCSLEAWIMVILDAAHNISWFHLVLTHVLLAWQHYRIWSTPIVVFKYPGILVPRLSTRLNIIIIWIFSALGGALLVYLNYKYGSYMGSCEWKFQAIITIITYVLPTIACCALAGLTLRTMKSQHNLVEPVPERRDSFRKMSAFSALFVFSGLPYNVYLNVVCFGHIADVEARIYILEVALLVYWSYVLFYPLVLYCYRPKSRNVEDQPMRRCTSTVTGSSLIA